VPETKDPGAVPSTTVAPAPRRRFVDFANIATRITMINRFKNLCKRPGVLTNDGHIIPTAEPVLKETPNGRKYWSILAEKNGQYLENMGYYDEDTKSKNSLQTPFQKAQAKAALPGARIWGVANALSASQGKSGLRLLGLGVKSGLSESDKVSPVLKSPVLNADGQLRLSPAISTEPPLNRRIDELPVPRVLEIPTRFLRVEEEPPSLPPVRPVPPSRLDINENRIPTIKIGEGPIDVMAGDKRRETYRYASTAPGSSPSTAGTESEYEWQRTSASSTTTDSDDSDDRVWIDREGPMACDAETIRAMNEKLFGKNYRPDPALSFDEKLLGSSAGSVLLAGGRGMLMVPNISDTVSTTSSVTMIDDQDASINEPGGGDDGWNSFEKPDLRSTRDFSKDEIPDDDPFVKIEIRSSADDVRVLRPALDTGRSFDFEEVRK